MTTDTNPLSQSSTTVNKSASTLCTEANPGTTKSKVATGSNRLFRWLWLLSLVNSYSLCQADVLTWDRSPFAADYRIWFSVGTGPFTIYSVVTETNAMVTMPLISSSRWYVTARNILGEAAPSNTITNYPTTTPPPITPAPPTNLQLAKISGNRRDLSWTSALDASTVVEKSIEFNPFEQMAIVPAGTQHWVDTKARQKRTSYRLKSCQATVCSAYSAEVVYTP